MTFERDLAADLAAEIRAVIAETAPASPRPSAPGAGAGREETARLALQRAQAHVTPAIPEAARFSRAKQVALRLLRFVWRDQGAFNALAIEAAGALAEAIVALREELALLRSDLERQRLMVDAKVALWARREAIENARLAALEAVALRDTATATPSPSPVSAIPPGVYSLFEERFRGTPEEIGAKQRDYLTFLQGIPGPVLDVGCGRGEFLRILREKRIPASGVEINPIAIAECREAGLDVEEGEGVAALARRAAGSLGAVVAFQVVEHWSPETTFTFLREARRALAPGGVLIAETVNVDSLSAWKAFFLDPSHLRPVPAEALRFLAEAAGFADLDIEYRAPLPPEERLTEASENDAKLNRLLFGPQDYALIARVPPAHGEIG